MSKHSLRAFLLCGSLPVIVSLLAIAQTPPPAAPPVPPPETAPALPPARIVDLMTPQGTALVGGQWKTLEAEIVEGPALPGAMAEYKTSYDIQPHAGESGFDDSAWPKIGADTLASRRGGGKVSFVWYRVNLTMPEKLGDFETSGATAVLTVLFDDYAEIWVNGQLARKAGYPSPAAIQGFNTANRVVLGDSVKPGDKFQIAVFGINGPISVAPQNFVFFREAKIEFFR